MVDANLVEGFRIGIAVGFVAGGLFGLWFYSVFSSKRS